MGTKMVKKVRYLQDWGDLDWEKLDNGWTRFRMRIYPSPNERQSAEQRLDLFEKRVKASQRSASRLGFPAPKMEVIGREVVSDGTSIYEAIDVGYDVLLDTNVGPWELCAILHHGVVEDEFNSNIIEAMPGWIESLPEWYRFSPALCDHCKVNRRRDTTAVCYNTETDEYVQVGSSCVAEYLQGSGTRLRKLMVFFRKVVDVVREDSLYTKPNVRVLEGVDTLRYLQYVTSSVREKGYSGHTASDAYSRLTSDKRDADYNANIGDEGLQRARRFKPTDLDRTFALQALGWAANLKPEEDREHNLRAIANSPFIHFNGKEKSALQTAVQLILSYSDHLSGMAKESALKTSSHFMQRNEVFGEVKIRGRKQRSNRPAIPVEVVSSEFIGWSRYKANTKRQKIQMRTLDGNDNLLVWCTDAEIARRHGMEEGNQLWLSGKVKSNSIDDGICQTVVYYCSKLREYTEIDASATTQVTAVSRNARNGNGRRPPRTGPPTTFGGGFEGYKADLQRAMDNAEWNERGEILEID